MENKCMYCGEHIPEGTMICKNCENELSQNTKEKELTKLTKDLLALISSTTNFCEDSTTEFIPLKIMRLANVLYEKGYHNIVDVAKATLNNLDKIIKMLKV